MELIDAVKIVRELMVDVDHEAEQALEVLIVHAMNCAGVRMTLGVDWSKIDGPGREK